MTRDKISNQEVQEMFQEGAIIARALHTQISRNKGEGFMYDLEEFDKEMGFLNSKQLDGAHQNVERDGSRNRSATLLVPDVDMDLFADVGLLYDADKSQIRSYMFHDSGTVSQFTQRENFFNINEDKGKFEPVLSRKDFLKKYDEYRKRVDGTDQQHVKYNEVLANLVPESLVGIVAKNDDLESKLRLLAIKQFMAQKYGLDLPMTIMQNGKIKTWSPHLDEIGLLLNDAKILIEGSSSSYPNKTKEKLLEDYIQTLGFSVKIHDFNEPITPRDISSINSNELTSRELIDSLHRITGIPKDGSLIYGIEGSLKEVVNIRLARDGLSKVNDVKNAVITKKDVEILLNLLDKELAQNKPNYKVMTNTELQSFTRDIIEKISFQRPSTGQQKALTTNVQKIGESKAAELEHRSSLLQQAQKLAELVNPEAKLFLEKSSMNSFLENNSQKRLEFAAANIARYLCAKTIDPESPALGKTIKEIADPLVEIKVGLFGRQFLHEVKNLTSIQEDHIGHRCALESLVYLTIEKDPTKQLNYASNKLLEYVSASPNPSKDAVTRIISPMLTGDTRILDKDADLILRAAKESNELPLKDRFMKIVDKVRIIVGMVSQDIAQVATQVKAERKGKRSFVEMVEEQREHGPPAKTPRIN